MLLAVQNLPNVYFHPSTSAAVEKFLTCPAALEFVQSDAVFKPLYITSSEAINSPRSELTYTKGASQKESEILLPVKSLKSDEAVKHLAFEIFNLKTNRATLLAKAEKGEMGIEEYARAFETQELEDTKAVIQLREQCSEIWNLPIDDLDYSRANMDLEANLFAQEIQCHTDDLRRQWIDLFKKVYCSKHPEDLHSCTAKKEDLCNFQEVMKDPNSPKAKKIIIDRTCKLYPSASQSLKNDPRLAGVPSYCPEAAQEGHIFLAATVGVIGGLAAAIFGVRTLYPNR